MIKLNKLKSGKYKIIDNGVIYNPKNVILHLGDDIFITALFDEDGLTDDIKKVAMMTKHDPPLYSVQFRSNSVEDLVEIIKGE